MEAALRDMKNGIATGNDHINIEPLKAGEDIISTRLAKLWKKAKMMIILKKGTKKDLMN